jgi:hypothetical protein
LSYNNFLVFIKRKESQEPILVSLYELIKDRSKFNFLTQLLKVFEEKDADCNFLSYAAHILASFPYNTEDEALYVVYSINRIVSLHASTANEGLKPIFSKKSVTKKGTLYIVTILHLRYRIWNWIHESHNSFDSSVSIEEFPEGILQPNWYVLFPHFVWQF